MSKIKRLSSPLNLRNKFRILDSYIFLVIDPVSIAIMKILSSYNL